MTDVLRIAYAVNLPLNRQATGADPTDTKGQPTPSPYQPLWPAGWGLLPLHETWSHCIFDSTLVVPSGEKGLVKQHNNTALLAYHAERNQYVLAFAGTVNELNALEDLLAIPVSAGPLVQGDIRQSATQHTTQTAGVVDAWIERLGALATSGARYVPESYAPPRRAQMHLGFRLAFESLNTHLTVGLERTLSAVLASLPEGAQIFVTGHSLGGGMANVAAAWLTSGNLKQSFDVKVYTFASPKSGNESFANWLNLRLANSQRFFRVFNALDTVPQVPFTYQLAKADLNNPQMLESLLPPSLPAWLTGLLEGFLNAELPGGASLNYTHAGSPYVLSGDEPMTFSGDTWPEDFFPGLPPQPFFPVNPNDSPEQQQAEAKNQAQKRQWWAHGPWVYLKLLKAQNAHRQD